MKGVWGFTLLLASIITIIGSNGIEAQRRPPPIVPTLPPGTEFTRQGVPIVQQSYSDIERQKKPVFNGPGGLDHYKDFVNDPWVDTENLNEILTSRSNDRAAAVELRSGRVSKDDDDIWQRQRNYRRGGRVNPENRRQMPYRRQETRPDEHTPAQWTHRRQEHHLHEQTKQRTDMRSMNRPQEYTTAQRTERKQENRPQEYTTAQRTERKQESRPQEYTTAQRTDRNQENRPNEYTAQRTNRNQETRPRQYNAQRTNSNQQNRPEQYTAQRTNMRTEDHDRSYPPLREIGTGEGRVLARVVDMRTGTEQTIRAANPTQQTWQNSYNTHRRVSSENRQTRAGNWVRSSPNDRHVTWTRPEMSNNINYPILNERAMEEKSRRVGGENVMMLA